jgi:hypothetical protein
MMSANGWYRLDKYNVKGTINSADKEAPSPFICLIHVNT